MNKKLKMVPIYLMLIAGAFTSIITYMLHYESKTALLILLGVLLFFYITGSLFSNLIWKFEKEQDEKERERLALEGKVVEKDSLTDAEQETDDENSVKDAGEQ